MKLNYYHYITEGLREWQRMVSCRNKESEIDMLERFIKLMGDEHFNDTFDHYFMGEMEFDGGWFGFHKSMRNTDFYDFGENSAHIDMLFWNFIHLSDLPYKVFKVFTTKMKDGLVHEIENDIDGSRGWDKFGFFRIR